MKADRTRGEVFATKLRRLDAAEVLRVSGGSGAAMAGKSGSGQDNQAKPGFQISHPSY